jgi:osmotically-inducible protein OsmY
MATESRSAQIERAIREVAGLDVVVEDQDGTIILEGMVDSASDRQAAEDIAADLSGGARIDNALEVQDELPNSVDDFLEEPGSAEPPVSVEAIGDDGLNPDLMDQQIASDPMVVIGDPDSAGYSGDEIDADDGDSAYVPPTDPVVTSDAHGGQHVLGGFSTTADDREIVPARSSDGRLGDEAIADAVREALLSDAATTDLQIRVVVRNGVVHLHGAVPLLDDADAAEEVASRVEGVREVQEELEVDETG